MPLAASFTAVRPMTVSRFAKNQFPRRRVGGIWLAAPLMREPTARSATPSTSGLQSAGKCSGG
jgi:nitrous oxidase accessory protein NosD